MLKQRPPMLVRGASMRIPKPWRYVVRYFPKPTWMMEIHDRLLDKQNLAGCPPPLLSFFHLQTSSTSDFPARQPFSNIKSERRQQKTRKEFVKRCIPRRPTNPPRKPTNFCYELPLANSRDIYSRQPKTQSTSWQYHILADV